MSPNIFGVNIPNIFEYINKFYCRILSESPSRTNTKIISKLGFAIKKLFRKN